VWDFTILALNHPHWRSISTNMHTSDPIFPDESLRGDPVLSAWGLQGSSPSWRPFLGFILTHGYVYRDAKRRA